jgi:hypothetical protein
MCRRTLSTVAREISLIALASYALDSFLNRERRQRLAGTKDPDPVLFAKRRISPVWPQRNSILRSLKVKFIARYKLEFLTNRLGQYDSPSLVESKSGAHTRILPFSAGFGHASMTFRSGQFEIKGRLHGDSTL